MFLDVCYVREEVGKKNVRSCLDKIVRGSIQDGSSMGLALTKCKLHANNSLCRKALVCQES